MVEQQLVPAKRRSVNARSLANCAAGVASAAGFIAIYSGGAVALGIT
jgi:hypothetical protein